MNLKDKIKNFPDSPGVYRFLDQNQDILYIGRATSLKKRVAQYFRSDIEPRIAEMVGQAKNIKYQTTDTILDSVILEANLIKKHWPKYNVKDKDNRSFVYIVIPKSDFPHPIIVRERELQKFPEAKNKIFGPYQNATMLRNALKIIRRIFPYSTCKPNQGKPCFDYQIGLCPGVCVGEISKKDYQQNIKNIILLLSGQKRRLFNKLKKDNPNQAKAFKQLQDVTLITNDELGQEVRINRIEGYDVSHLSGQEVYGAMSVFTDGQADKAQYRLFKIREFTNNDLHSLGEMIVRRFRHLEWSKPDLILIDGGKPQVDFVYKILQDININIPIVGISKLAGDKLVFPIKTKKTIKDLAESIKRILQEVRDEAHRFGNKARIRGKKIK